MSERTIYTVSRLNREVRLLLERGLPAIWIEAEISNLARPSSGHWYFSLKDADAQIRCAMFRQRNSSVGFAPRDGMAVLARGRVSLYEPRGDYQLIVESLEEAGLGALQREFERLKARLSAEGLFDPAARRPLPEVPARIGVITSPTGAAIRDILHVLRKRFPPAQVRIYPTPVQGAAAVPGLLGALALAAARQDCDVLILARGGGSIEDLWAFNDERVARAIRAMPMPVVTGIGHEVDFTIADFVADVRAPTPSAAAQLVVPDARAWSRSLGQVALRLATAVQRAVRDRGQLAAQLAHRLQRASPGAQLSMSAQRLDDLDQRLRRAVRTRLQEGQHLQSSYAQRLAAASPVIRVRAGALALGATRLRLAAAMRGELARATHRTVVAVRGLDALSPLAVLDRGYALVTSASGALVTDAGQVRTGDLIDTRLARGQLRSKVIE